MHCPVPGLWYVFSFPSLPGKTLFNYYGDPTQPTTVLGAQRQLPDECLLTLSCTALSGADCSVKQTQGPWNMLSWVGGTLKRALFGWVNSGLFFLKNKTLTLASLLFGHSLPLCLCVECS